MQDIKGYLYNVFPKVIEAIALLAKTFSFSLVAGNHA